MRLYLQFPLAFLGDFGTRMEMKPGVMEVS